MALYLDNQDGAYWNYGTAPRKVVVAGQQVQPAASNDGSAYPMASSYTDDGGYVPYPSDTTTTAAPLDLSTFGTSGYSSSTSSNSALANLQGMAAAPYKTEKFFSKEDKTLFKEIHGTELELARHVQSLRQTVDAMGKIDAQNQELTQTLAQLNDGIRQLKQAAANRANVGQLAQINSQLAQLNQQKLDAERTKARITEERTTHMKELTETKIATQKYETSYRGQMDAVTAAHTLLENKAKTDKATLDANSVDKAPYLRKQSGDMKKTLSLIGQALDEVEDIENGQTAPILNTENDPAPVESETTDTTAEEEEAQGKLINDVLRHLKGVAEKKGGLRPEDLDKIKTYLEKDGDFTLDDEDLRKSLRPLVHGENKLSDEGKEAYINTLGYVQENFETVAKAQTFDDFGFHLGQAITGQDLGAILDEKTEPLEKLKKDLGGALGAASESESSTDESESGPTGGEIAGGLAATGATLYGTKKLKDKFGKQAGAAAKSAATSVGETIGKTQTGKRVMGAASRLKNFVTAEAIPKTVTRVEPAFEKVSVRGMEEALGLKDVDKSHFELKKDVDAAKKAANKAATTVEKPPEPPKVKSAAQQASQQPLKAKVAAQQSQKSSLRQLGNRKKPVTVQTTPAKRKPPTKGLQFGAVKTAQAGANTAATVSKAGLLSKVGTGIINLGRGLFSKANIYMMGLTVIMGVASQAGAVPGQTSESAIPDA